MKRPAQIRSPRHVRYSVKFTGPLSPAAFVPATVKRIPTKPDDHLGPAFRPADYPRSGVPILLAESHVATALGMSLRKVRKATRSGRFRAAMQVGTVTLYHPRELGIGLK